MEQAKIKGYKSLGGSYREMVMVISSKSKLVNVENIQLASQLLRREKKVDISDQRSSFLLMKGTDLQVYCIVLTTNRVRHMCKENPVCCSITDLKFYIHLS